MKIPNKMGFLSITLGCIVTFSGTAEGTVDLTYIRSALEPYRKDGIPAWPAVNSAWDKQLAKINKNKDTVWVVGFVELVKPDVTICKPIQDLLRMIQIVPNDARRLLFEFLDDKIESEKLALCSISSEKALALLRGITFQGKPTKVKNVQCYRDIAPTIDAKEINNTQGLSPNEITTVIRKGLDNISTCYGAALKKKPDLKGRISTYFTIEAIKGKVQEVCILKKESTIKEKTFQRCVTNEISTWQFPKPRGAESVKITYPFKFEPT